MKLWPRDDRAGGNLSILEMKFHPIMKILNQWSADFLRPGTGFMEDIFICWQGRGWFWEDLNIFIYCVLYYYYISSTSDDQHQIPDTGVPCFKSYNRVLFFVSICPLVLKWSQSFAIPSLPPVFSLLCSSFLFFPLFSLFLSVSSFATSPSLPRPLSSSLSLFATQSGLPSGLTSHHP